MSLLRKLTNPFRRLWLSMGLLVVLAGVTVLKIYHASSSRRESEAALAEPGGPQKPAGPAPLGEAKETPPKTVTEEFGQTFSNFVLPQGTGPKKPEGPPPVPEEVRRKFVNPATPISLYPPEPAPRKPASPVPPTYYLPSFRTIRCELIAGPETGAIETPLIGVVLENQYEIDPDGVTRVVIPAGVEVHGVGKTAPMRDRIDGKGKWTFVWRTRDENNAMELSVEALALNRDFDERAKTYGDSEKSPGIVGQRIESGADKVIEEALLASASAITRDLKSYTSVLNPLTSQVVNEQQPTVGNALLEGGAAGADSIAQKLDDIRKQIDDKGYYVAVLPGKEFYLYTKEPIDLRKARRPQALTPGAKAGSSVSDHS